MFEIGFEDTSAAFPLPPFSNFLFASAVDSALFSTRPCATIHFSNSYFQLRRLMLFAFLVSRAFLLFL